MDFFRRIDKDQDGKVTRQEFIEGILSSSKCLAHKLSSQQSSQSLTVAPPQNFPPVVWR